MSTAEPSVAPLRPPVIEIRPVRMEDGYAVLALHREAFGDKFQAAFGPHRLDVGIEAMAETWRRQGPAALRGMYVATTNGRVVGTATLRTWEMGVDDGGAAEVAFSRALGPWGAFRAVFTLSLLDHLISSEEGYITDVAVLAEFRRQGVARALLQHIEHEALVRRKRYLSLYVSARNSGARTLYRSLGYYERRVRRSPLAGLLLKHFSWVFMQKRIGDG